MNSEPIWPGLIIGIIVFVAILAFVIDWLRPSLRDEDDYSGK
jgi:hypothetical protein